VSPEAAGLAVPRISQNDASPSATGLVRPETCMCKGARARISVRRVWVSLKTLTVADLAAAVTFYRSSAGHARDPASPSKKV
jgi:hypothetical protein